MWSYAISYYFTSGCIRVFPECCRLSTQRVALKSSASESRHKGAKIFTLRCYCTGNLLLGEGLEVLDFLLGADEERHALVNLHSSAACQILNPDDTVIASL